MSDVLLETRNLTKQFPGVLANDNVNFTVKKGEIHAIIGENGAGKSTLMNMIYGLLEPSAGEIYFKGSPVKITNTLQSIKLGIGMVHQHFMLVPSFTVAENIVLGSEIRKNKFLTDKKKAEEITAQLSATYGLAVEPGLQVKYLSVGLQQRVEILKVLYKGADVLILDEPTAVLTPNETVELFTVIKRLVKEQGKTVIIITHKLQEVLDLSDRVTIMRQGRVIETIETKDANEQILAEMMVGREVLFNELERKEWNHETVLEIEGLTVNNDRNIEAVKGVSFHLRSGEILGVAGIEGNGQSELLEAITGLRTIQGGTYLIKGKDAKNKSPKYIRDLGLAHIPEDRISTGLSVHATISENLIMGLQHKEPFAIKKVHLNSAKIRDRVQNLIKEFDVRTYSEEVLVKNLSGGNMQKIVIAREFSFDTPILIISQPTRGVDIGAIEFIHAQIMKKRNEGAAILLLSAELDEIMSLSDRIITIYEGRVSGTFENKNLSRSTLGLHMTSSNKEGSEIRG